MKRRPRKPNLHKSEAGWERFRKRTQCGKRARRAYMSPYPKGDLVK